MGKSKSTDTEEEEDDEDYGEDGKQNTSHFYPKYLPSLLSTDPPHNIYFASWWLHDIINDTNQI